MNISKYKALIVAVDLGSFSAAAHKLGYTQSGLSHMMNSLEDELSVSLVTRGYFGIKLTPAGERIIPKIREMVAAEDALRNEIELIKNYGDNVVRIGAFSSMAAKLLPSIIERFSAEMPDVTVNVQMGTVAELYGGLDEGRFDICFGSRNPKYDFKWTHLFSDRFYAVLPADYPIEAEEFPISRFNGTKFLMPGLGFDDDINAVFSEHNVRPFVTETYVDDPAIISMVEHNLGISMLSELIIRGCTDNVRLVPITPTVARELSIAINPNRPQTLPIKKLISLSKDYVKRLGM